MVRKLVILDDKRLVGNALKMGLETHDPSIKVCIVTSANELFDLLQMGDVRAVIVNGQLGGSFTGPKVVGEIKRRFTHIKIVGFSSEDELREEFLRNGATLYLSKSASLEYSETAIIELLRYVKYPVFCNMILEIRLASFLV